MNDTLPTTLRQLRLSGLLASLDVRLQEAQSHALNHREFLELILQDELAVRADRQMQRRLKAAGFRELKTLDDFEWAFNPSVKKKQIFDLASGRYLREVRDVLFLGPPGVGKRLAWLHRQRPCRRGRAREPAQNRQGAEEVIQT
jgi:DNA replication protein DnaC